MNLASLPYFHKKAHKRQQKNGSFRSYRMFKYDLSNIMCKKKAMRQQIAVPPNDEEAHV